MKTPSLTLKGSKHLGTLLVAITIVLGLLFIGVSIERARYNQPPPANQQCKEYALQTEKQLYADMQTVFGKERPEAPNREQIKNLAIECDENLGRYEFIEGENK